MNFFGKEHGSDTSRRRNRRTELWKAAASVAMLFLAFIISITPIHTYFSDITTGQLTLYLNVPGTPDPVYFVKIVSGNYHTMALTNEGRVYAWGYNAEGQIGKGSSGSAHTPVLLTFPDNNVEIVDIAASEYSSYAVGVNGKVYSWGDGISNKLGNGSTSDISTPASVTMPVGVHFVKVSAYYHSACALSDDGDVYAWGSNSTGQCGNGGAGATVSIPTKISTLSNIKEISMGAFAGAAINQNGDLYTWGSDTYHQLGDSANSGSDNLPGTYSGLTNIKFVYVASWHTIAIAESGQVYTWGAAESGKLGNDSITADIKTPWATPITNGVQASGNLYNSIVLTADGQVYVCGSNNYGELGLGDLTARRVFTLIPNVTNATWVTQMIDTSAILAGNNVYSMGYNDSYQYGNDTTTEKSVPTIWTRPIP
jgi:alpha-tubulin suppressor-like RCC1 family protein